MVNGINNLYNPLGRIQTGYRRVFLLLLILTTSFTTEAVLLRVGYSIPCFVKLRHDALVKLSPDRIDLHPSVGKAPAVGVRPDLMGPDPSKTATENWAVLLVANISRVNLRSYKLAFIHRAWPRFGCARTRHRGDPQEFPGVTYYSLSVKER